MARRSSENEQLIERAIGGKAVSGANVGLLLLEAQFPRIPGDGGNASTWPFPMLYKVVESATPDRVVRGHAQGLVDQFVAAGRELIAMGADGITTNCGFMVLHQGHLAQTLQVPVAASSLLQVPAVQALLPPGQRVGIVTIDKASLSEEVLLAAGAPADTPVVGTEHGHEFHRVLLGDELELDVAKARADVVSAACDLVAHHDDIGALVLECTNMPPYAAEIRAATGKPVYDFYSFVSWFQAGISPRRFV